MDVFLYIQNIRSWWEFWYCTCLSPYLSSSHGHKCIKETFVMWEHVWDTCDVRACIFWCRESYTCPSPTCEVPMVDHIRRFVHGHGCINVLLKKLDNPVPGAQENILLWSWCRRCKQVREAGGRWWLCKQLRWNGDRGVDNAHRWKPGGMGDGANRTRRCWPWTQVVVGGWEMVAMVPKSGRRRREMWYQQNLKSSLKWILIIAFCLASKIGVVLTGDSSCAHQCRHLEHVICQVPWPSLPLLQFPQTRVRWALPPLLASGSLSVLWPSRHCGLLQVSPRDCHLDFSEERSSALAELCTIFFNVIYRTLLPSVSTSALGMFCGAKYTRHTVTSVIKR